MTLSKSIVQGIRTCCQGVLALKLRQLIICCCVQEYYGVRVDCTNQGVHSNAACICMPCKVCPMWHHVYVTQRQRTEAYYCKECRK